MSFLRSPLPVWGSQGKGGSVGKAPSQHPLYSTGFPSVFQIFIWIGKDANEVEKKESMKSGKLSWYNCSSNPVWLS